MSKLSKLVSVEFARSLVKQIDALVVSDCRSSVHQPQTLFASSAPRHQPQIDLTLRESLPRISALPHYLDISDAL